MRLNAQVFIFLSILFLMNVSCNRRSKKAESLQQFNSEQWKSDKNGCSGERSILKNELLGLKHKMRGLKASEIENLLGKPDAQELYNRSQRYYIYFIEPGPKCDQAIDDPQGLFVRFSAVGIANEFVIRSL